MLNMQITKKDVIDALQFSDETEMPKKLKPVSKYNCL